MGVLTAILTPFRVFNDWVLPVGRVLGLLLVALMVLAILTQVFYRYVLGNPLAWPDEAARFCMLWMTGLVAPLAYRRGGFVAIDTLTIMLPTRAQALLSLFLLVIAAFVLIIAVQIGYTELTGFNARFSTSSLWYPTSLDFSTWEKVPRWWMQASLFVGVVLLLIVNIELMIRSLITLLGGENLLPPVGPAEDDVIAE